MAINLLPEAAEDAETALVAWLSPLRPGATSNTRRTGDPLPFTLIQLIAGKENVDESYADPVLQVDTLCDRNLGGPDMGHVAAKVEADKTHRRMLWLARYLDDVPMPDGRMATIDYVNVFTMPRWLEYGDDQILRKTARYQLGLSYSPVP